MTNPPVYSPAKTIILLFAAVITLGFFTSQASMTIDPPARFQITKSMVDHGDMQIRLDQNNPDMMYRYDCERFLGPDGNYTPVAVSGERVRAQEKLYADAAEAAAAAEHAPVKFRPLTRRAE